MTLTDCFEVLVEEEDGRGDGLGVHFQDVP